MSDTTQRLHAIAVSDQAAKFFDEVGVEQLRARRCLLMLELLRRLVAGRG